MCFMQSQTIELSVVLIDQVSTKRTQCYYWNQYRLVSIKFQSDFSLYKKWCSHLQYMVYYNINSTRFILHLCKIADYLLIFSQFW